jgi:hypothetical protein
MITAFYTADRPRYPLSKKLNPLWWFENDEAAPGDTFVYLYVRNFMMNFKRFVIGIGDRDHWVTGRGPNPLLVLRSDVGLSAWQWAFLWVLGLPLLPFVSYSGSRVEWYLGWQPWGEFSFKWNLLKSPFQVW